ncbi:MAG: hypothetical protein WEB53_05585 [Akkermansiaceae bacterium]
MKIRYTPFAAIAAITSLLLIAPVIAATRPMNVVFILKLQQAKIIRNPLAAHETLTRRAQDQWPETPSAESKRSTEPFKHPHFPTFQSGPRLFQPAEKIGFF